MAAIADQDAIVDLDTMLLQCFHLLEESWYVDNAAREKKTT